MALTPEQEALLLANVESSKASIAALTEGNKTLTAALAAKDADITALKSNVHASSQETALLALKAKFPDVPEETLRALPEASREAQGKVLQDTLGKFKAPAGVKTGAEAWRDVGGIGPSVEAENAEALALRETERNKAVQSGDFMNVLRVKSRDTVDFIRKNFATR